MKPICSLECDDCGKFFVGDEDYICIWVIEDDAQAVSRCAHCDRVVFNFVPANLLAKLAERGVKIFHWEEGEYVI